MKLQGRAYTIGRQQRNSDDVSYNKSGKKLNETVIKRFLSPYSWLLICILLLPFMNGLIETGLTSAGLIHWASGSSINSYWLAGVLMPMAGIALAILYVLPLLISTARGAKRLFSICAVNLLTGWTLLGWMLALHMALKTPCSDNARKDNQFLGITLTILCILLGFGFNIIVSRPEFGHTLAGFYLLQFIKQHGDTFLSAALGILSLHWGCTQYRLHRDLSSPVAMRPFDALIAAVASSGIWFFGYVLAEAALILAFVVSPITDQIAKIPMGSEQRATVLTAILALSMIFMLLTVLGVLCFSVALNMKLLNPLIQEQSRGCKIFLKRSIVGLAFASVCVYAAGSAGSGAFAPLIINSLAGLSFVLAYGYTGSPVE